MSSGYRQNGGYTPQQIASYYRAQQAAQAQQAQRSAASYPSPESNSPGSDGSSPDYNRTQQQSPTLYRAQPPPGHQHSSSSRPSGSPQQPPPPRRSSTSTSTKDPQYYCFYPEHQPHVAFARKADMQRHYDQVHNAPRVRTLDCPEVGCARKGPERGFGRKDKLVEHLREVHKRDIPKRVYEGRG